MAIGEDELRALERLSSLKIDEASREKLKKQLSDIIDFVNKLQAIDTSGYSERYSVTFEEQYLRDDNPEECLSRDEVLSQAPESEDGFFKVPPVIEGEELES